MADVTATYEGELCVKCVHTRTQTSVMAESKIQDFGHDDSFTPIDLFGSSFGACLLVTMGYYANRHNIDITGAEVDVTTTLQGWNITEMAIVIRMPPNSYPDKEKKALEKCIDTCPIHNLVKPEVKQNISFIWL